MSSTTVAHLTFEEFEKMPERPGKDELLNGELIELPPPELQHNLIAERLFLLLTRVLREGSVSSRFGGAHHEMGYRFGRSTWLVPDVSIEHLGQAREKYFLDSPALAVEIVSESNTAELIEAKVSIYLENGALEVWILYPKQQHIRAFRPNGTTEVFSGTFRSQLLGGAEINLTEILAD